MKMDTKGIDPRIILSERFRSAQEVTDRGFQIVGNGITFPGDGVKFTGAAGQRLVLPQTPSRALALMSFSAHVSFTPGFAKADNADRYVFGQDPAGGFFLWSPSVGGLFTAMPGDWWKVSGAATVVREVWREYEKNHVSYSLRNGELRLWMNGVQVGTASSSPLPAAGSFVNLPLIVGASGGGTGFAGVWIGTIHAIDWFSTTMTIEDHLDFMHNDTYSEIF